MTRNRLSRQSVSLFVTNIITLFFHFVNKIRKKNLKKTPKQAFLAHFERLYAV